jgi:hypothetical protein
MFLLK